MDDVESLQAAVARDPKDLTARLILADVVQESGDDAGAELIRIRVAIARLGAPPLVTPISVSVSPRRQSYDVSEDLAVDCVVYRIDLVVCAPADVHPEGTVIDVVLGKGGPEEIICGVRVQWGYQVIDGPADNYTLECIVEEDGFPRRAELAPLRRRERELNRTCAARTHFD